MVSEQRSLWLIFIRQVVAVDGISMVCLDPFPNRKDARCITSVMHPSSKTEKSFLVTCFFYLLALPSILASPKCLKLA